MDMRQVSLLLSSCLCACYGAPVESNLQIEVVPREASPRADGRGLADVRVTPSEADAVFRRMISVRASSGRFLSPEAPAEGPPALVRIAPSEGPLELVLRYGRVDGPLVVEAQRAEAFARGLVELAPRGPDRIELEIAPRRLLADGRDQARLTVDLRASDGEVSLGVEVHLATCCETSDGLAPCPGGPPIRLPLTLTLEDPTRPLEADVVAGYLPRTSTASEDLRVWVRATNRPLVESCDQEPTVVAGEVVLTLSPSDG